MKLFQYEIDLLRRYLDSRKTKAEALLSPVLGVYKWHGIPTDKSVGAAIELLIDRAHRLGIEIH